MGALQPLRRSTAIQPAVVRPTTQPKPVTRAHTLRPIARDSVALTGLAGRQPLTTMNVAALEDRISRETGTVLTQGNKMELFVDGQEAYPRIMSMIQGAERSLHMQMYIFTDDKAGWDVAEALADRAAHGVKVRVSADYIGTSTNSPLFEFLRQNGVEVRHHALSGVKSQIDHRKIIVADGHTAMTGVMNIADDYRDTWHDTMITIQGPVVAEIQREFLRGWQDHGGSAIADNADVFPPLPAKAPGATAMRVVTTYPDPDFQRTLFAAIDSAGREINLEMPYFSDETLVNKLIAAAKRGVKVNLVLPGKSDVGLMDAAAKAHFQRIKNAGITIYLYQGRIMHAKLATVDGVWGTIGSGNGDARSLRLHREMNVTLNDPAAVATLNERVFAADFKASLKLETFQPTIGERMKNWVARKLAPVL
ncbi:MAG: phosphatidylserine/phosphatidylglycerophosphate/cardiolipin synthase family protein [Candidatus Sericytochromatia bacterium]|nr:phosphatidylserine/phosphatidylglycerophosphate/cardiolipin synthase family protein [Candidatus Sericytochromatia bacterium]